MSLVAVALAHAHVCVCVCECFRGTCGFVLLLAVFRNPATHNWYELNVDTVSTIRQLVKDRMPLRVFMGANDIVTQDSAQPPAEQQSLLFD